MRIDILKDIEHTIECGLEDNGVKSVEIGEYAIRVEIESARAFARLFPNQEERVARKTNYEWFVEATDGEYVFFIRFNYVGAYNEFKEHYPVVENWSEENA